MAESTNSRVVERSGIDQDFLRRKTLTAHNEATMRTVIDSGEFGKFVTDEPVPHGGTGQGPSPLQAVLGALGGCEGVTFNRTAADLGFEYDSLEFEAAFTIDIRGRLGDRQVRPHFQTVRVRAVVATASSRPLTSARPSAETWALGSRPRLSRRWSRRPRPAARS